MSYAEELYQQRVNRHMLWRSKSVEDQGIDLKREKPGTVNSLLKQITEMRQTIEAMRERIVVLESKAAVPFVAPPPRPASDAVPEPPDPTPILPLTIDRAIQQAVCKFYRIGRSDLLSSHRTVRHIRPRHVAIYLIRKITDKPVAKIGHQFGGRDHSTIIHAIHKIGEGIRTDAHLAEEVRSIVAMLVDSRALTADQANDLGILGFAGEVAEDLSPKPSSDISDPPFLPGRDA